MSLKDCTRRIQKTLNRKHGATLKEDGGYGMKTASEIEAALIISGDSIQDEKAILEITHNELPDNCYSRRALESPTGIVVHYVSAWYAARDRWADLETIFTQTHELNLPGAGRGDVLPVSEDARAYASYHYVIGREGEVWHMTPLDRQAYHAGKSTWAGRDHCNRWTFGVALVAHPDPDYTEAQYEALAALVDVLKAEYSITEIFGHDECAPDRKVDPGPAFDWARVR